MSADSSELRVPPAMRRHVGEVVAITDSLCDSHLDAEYAALCRRLVVKLACKRPSPLANGDLRSWAAGAIYAVGANNFLSDPSQRPHLSTDQLGELLVVPISTMSAKAARIRAALGLSAMEVELCRRDRLENHPLAWMVRVDEMTIDARWLPAELQAEARRRGLIPGLPRSEAA